MSGIPKKYSYTDIDGLHWPDANVGDNLFYSIDFNCWLHEESETITSVNWIIPEGVESEQDLVTDNIGHVKIETPNIGSYKIVCELGTTELGLDQVNAIPMIIKVY